MTQGNLAELAGRVTDSFVIPIRRTLHAHPELRWQENETLNLIRKEIEGLKCEHLSIREMKGGLVVDFNVDLTSVPRRRLLFRADIDALPIQEATGLIYASEVKGVMHACGHDTHAAMLLGVLNLIAKGKVPTTRNLRFVFQRAEENPTTQSGGDSLVSDGVCEGIEAAYALHIWCSPKTGTPGVLMSRPGAMIGNSGRLKFVIRTKGGHVAHPNTGGNALQVVNAIINHLNGFVARHFAPTEPATLEPVILNAGTASNVMPSEAELWLGFRTLLPRKEHIATSSLIVDEVERVALAFGAGLTSQEFHGHPTLFNDQTEYEKVAGLLANAGQKTRVMEPELGGEDFAHYLRVVPGCMWALGAHTPGTGDHHSPTFCPDESVFYKGVLFWLLLATM